MQMNMQNCLHSSCVLYEHGWFTQLRLWLHVNLIIERWDMSTSGGEMGGVECPGSSLDTFQRFCFELDVFWPDVAKPADEVGALWRCSWSLVTLGSSQVSILTLTGAKPRAGAEDIWDIYLSSVFYWNFIAVTILWGFPVSRLINFG